MYNVILLFCLKAVISNNRTITNDFFTSTTLSKVVPLQSPTSDVPLRNCKWILLIHTSLLSSFWSDRRQNTGKTAGFGIKILCSTNRSVILFMFTL